MNIYKKPSLNKCLLFTGISLTCIGSLLLIYTTAIFDFIIGVGMSVTPTSAAFRGWQKTQPLNFDIYFFNWTNPEDIYNASVKPKFQEVGPYKFKMVVERVNVTWHENNTVTYMTAKHFYWDDDSPRKLNDTITTLNIVALGTAHAARHWSYFSQKSISITLSMTSEIHVTKTAGELLFEGYDDSILDGASFLSSEKVNDKFGLFYNRNGTPEGGLYNMWTKTDKNFGKIMNWNGEKKTHFYEKGCGDVRGSSGGFFPFGLNRDRIEFFESDLCKTLVFEYDSDVVVNGVPSYKYTGKNLFDNGTARAEDSCFCNDVCIPTGVLNVSSCRLGSPTFMSLPHFYNADPYYTNAVEGLKPEKDKHDFYFTLEPKAGIVMETAGRMQLNMLLHPVENILMFENVPTVFFPIFYCDQVLTVGGMNAFSIMIMHYLTYCISSVAIIFVFVGIYLILRGSLRLSRPKMSENSSVTISSLLPEEKPLNCKI